MHNSKCRLRIGERSRPRPVARLKFAFFLSQFAVCNFAFSTPVQADIESAAFEAYQVARNWVERGLVPEQTLSIRAQGVSAVHVTLRVQGWTVGQATAAAPAAIGPSAGESMDLMPLVASALRQALREARAALATRGAALTDGTQLVLDLQVARPLDPLRLESLAQLPRRIVPHAHGLAVSRDARWAWSFPGNAIAANTDLNGQLNRLAAELDIPLARKATIGTVDGPALYRFEVVHITAPVGENEPVRLYRGNELLATEPLDDQALALLAEQWADYLVERQREDGRFAGTYEPTADQYQPETADAASVAMAAYALARAAKLAGVSQNARSEAAHRAAEVLAGLIGRPDHTSRQIIGHDAEVTALTLLALTTAAPQRKSERDRLLEALGGMLDAQGRFRTSLDAAAGPCSLETQSLAAAAMVAGFEQTRDPKLLDQATRALAAAWRQADESTEHRLLPWVAIAESALIRLDRPTGHAQKLADLCDRMWQRQIQPWGDAAGRHSPDTIGGFLVGGRLYEEPTAESAAVLAGLASVMGSERIVPEDQRVRWLIGSGLAGRFLDQLTLQPSGAYYTRNPDEAIGGVRIALWDNRQPLRTTATALIALTELRQALAQWAQRL